MMYEEGSVEYFGKKATWISCYEKYQNFVGLLFAVEAIFGYNHRFNSGSEDNQCQKLRVAAVPLDDRSYDYHYQYRLRVYI